MLEVIEGRAPLPRVLPPYQVGLFATRGGRNPTVVNNVETLANVPGILREGPGWLRARGTEDSPGTMLFTLCGDVRRPGVYELPLGTPLGTLIEEVGGGTPRDRQLRAMLPGASAAVLTPEDLSVPLDFDALREAGSALGSGGFAVYDDSACMVSVAATFSRFLYAESCGQCPACKKGSREITGWLERVARGTGDPDDLERARSRCDSVTGGQRCGLPSGEAAVVRSLLDTFGDEFERHLGRSCTQRRQRPLPLLEDFDEAARRFVYTGRHVYRVDRGSAGSDATTSEERADAGWIDVG